MKKMKRFKKFTSMVLAVAMTLAMTLPVMATGTSANKSITIKPSPTVKITDQSEFTAYKILNAVDVGTDNEIAYTVPDELKDFYKERYGLTGEESNFAYKVTEKINAEKDLYAFGKAVKEKLVDTQKITGKTGNKVGDNYVISSLDVGYYLVLDSATGEAASQVILDTTVDNVEVVVKADVPTIDKSIIGSEDGENTDGDPTTNGMVSANNEAIGDDVPYELKTKVPAMSGYTHYRFVISDTLSKGLSYNADTLSIKIGETELIENTHYTVTTTGNSTEGTNIRIVFKDFYQNWKDVSGADIVVRYTAELTEDAEIGTTGNPNTVKLLYSNNPSNEGEGDDFGPADVPGETEEITVRTYVTGLQLNKVNANGNELKGAVFTLSGTRVNQVNQKGAEFVEDTNGTYWKLKDGTFTTKEPNDKTSHLYEEDGRKYAKKAVANWVTSKDHVVANATVNDDGVLIFEGLAAGEYEIKEITAPDGYNLLKETIFVTIRCNNGEDECEWTGTFKIGETGEQKDLQLNNGILSGMDIVNNTGTELPSTGGIGTTIFYIIGGILVVGAAILLITKKRMSKEA